jgi:hypothetical protein
MLSSTLTTTASTDLPGDEPGWLTAAVGVCMLEQALKSSSRLAAASLL